MRVHMTGLLAGLGIVVSSWCQSPKGVTLREALADTLRQHPALSIQVQQVAGSQAALLRAQGQFDRRVTADASQSHTYSPLTELDRAVLGRSSVTSNLTTVQASETQLLRNGISMGPTLDWSRTTDNTGIVSGLNESHLQFQINVPLARGKGRQVTAANETAAALDVAAEFHDLTQTAAVLLTNTATAYWGAEAARRSLEVYTAAEQRGQVYLETVQALIAGDKLPRVELSQVLANLAVRKTARIASEQDLVQARQQLALNTGDDSLQLQRSVGTEDALPALSDQSIETSLLVEQALRLRGDLLAARKRQEESATLVLAARDALRPQIDLRIDTGYSGLREGSRIDKFPLALASGVRGVDLIGGIHYEFVPSNRAAMGNAAQSTVASRQAALRVAEMARQIASSVVVAAAAVRGAMEQVRAARASTAYAESALTNEQEKLRLGFSSVVDVLTIEDRYQLAQLAHVQAEAEYATALARLRLATGTIVHSGREINQVDPAVFLTLPVVGAK